MKKRFLSALLVMAMMLTMAPAALAAEGDGSTTETTSYEATYTDSDGNVQNAESLSTAISSVKDGGTVTLLKDVALSATQEITGTLTIDLNGYKISNGTIAKNGYMLKINYGATLNLVGNAENSAIIDSRTNTTGTVTAICVLGELHVKGDNLTISRGKGIAIKVDESGADKLGKLTVESGTITSDQAVQNWGISTITGGTFNGDVNSAAYSDIGGQLTIIDGTFSKNVYTWQMKYPSDWPNAAAKIDISGGTFNGTIAELYGDGVENLQPVTNVSFPADGSCPEGVVSITGGTFSSDVEDYCAIGYTTQEANGAYQVVPTGGMEVKTETTGDSVSVSVGGSYNTDDDQNGDEVNTENSTIQIDVTTGSKESGSSDPVADEGVTSATVSIANESLTSVTESSNDVSLVTDAATLNISSDAWADMTRAADSAAVVISVEVKKENDKVTGWEITAKAGNADVFTDSTPSTIDVTVPYSALEGAADVVVYCTDEGQRGPMKTTWDKNGGKLTWTTPHFSGFAAQEVAEDAETTWVTNDENAATGSGSLTQALNAMAASGGTITLRKDIEVSNESITAASEAIYTIPNGVTLDGAGHSITAKAEGWTENNSQDYPQKNPILGVTAEGATVTIKNLTIVGHSKTRHGINVWSKTADSSSQPNVTLENVKIQNCGTAAVVVSNGKVTATNLTTSGNTWGAVNVDNGGSFTLKGDDNDMAEPAKIWTEKPAGSASGATSITLDGSNFSSFDDVKGVGDNLKGFTYYTDDVSELGEAYNETTKTVYEDLDTALDSSNVNENDVVTVVKNASLDSDASIPENVTLKVAEDVTLTIEEGATLTNNGTLENSGTISGNVEGSGRQTSIVTFSVTPANATIVVKDSDGNEVSAVDGKYALENGKTYTYTVSKSGYRTQTGTVAVTKAETITVSLSSSSNNGSSSSNSGYAVSVSPASNGSVTVSPKSASKGDTVTITVTPDEGYELDSLVVTDKDGKEIALTEKDGKYTFVMPQSKVTVTAAFAEVQETEEPAALPFTDVDPASGYYEAIRYAYENNLMNGTSATAFSPNGTTSRAMIVTILYRLEGQPAVAAGSFTDVAAGQYYTSAVAWASQNGIVEGYGNGAFGPNDAITREQLAVILYRYAQYKGYAVSAGAGDISGYADYDQVSGWAQEAMQWANTEGLITGTTATTLSPGGSAIRAQVATILMRFCENVAK